MACPRGFFDVTSGGQPVGRVIMEVSLLMFRRNLTIFFRDDITLGFEEISVLGDLFGGT